MKLTSSQIKKLNKLSKKKPIMVRVNQNWYTWAEGDPKYGVFLTTKSGADVEFDFKQIDDIQESKMMRMKSKLREMIREELNEAGIYSDYHQLNRAYMDDFIKNYKKLNRKNVVKKSDDDVYGFRKGEREAHWKYDNNFKLHYGINKQQALGLINSFNRVKDDHPWS